MLAIAKGAEISETGLRVVNSDLFDSASFVRQISKFESARGWLWGDYLIFATESISKRDRTSLVIQLANQSQVTTDYLFTCLKIAEIYPHDHRNARVSHTTHLIIADELGQEFTLETAVDWLTHAEEHELTGAQVRKAIRRETATAEPDERIVADWFSKAKRGLRGWSDFVIPEGLKDDPQYLERLQREIVQFREPLDRLLTEIEELRK